MKYSLLAFLFLLFFSGCSSKTDDAIPDGAARQETATAPSDVSSNEMAPPDALHPVNSPGEFPLGWKVRLDRPNADVVIGADKETADVSLVNMTPGWHFKTKTPRVIIYHPASSLTGNFSVSSTIHLFNPDQRNEAYGLFFGGSNLDNDKQAYTYFVIRRTGEFLIKKRVGETTEVINDWTTNEAIVPFDENTDGTAPNTLEFSVTGDNVSFSINGVQVFAMPKGDLQTDGIVGFRFNHSVEAHIETFEAVTAS